MFSELKKAQSIKDSKKHTAEELKKKRLETLVQDEFPKIISLLVNIGKNKDALQYLCPTDSDLALLFSGKDPHDGEQVKLFFNRKGEVIIWRQFNNYSFRIDIEADPMEENTKGWIFNFIKFGMTARSIESRFIMNGRLILLLSGNFSAFFKTLNRQYDNLSIEEEK